MTIDDLIKQAVAKAEAINAALTAEGGASVPDWAKSVRGSAEPDREMVPTLAKGVCRPASPMLRARFAAFGRWRIATHGHWLSLSDMSALWQEPEPSDELLRDIRDMRQAAEEDWPNEASALFRPERLSLFAGNDVSNDKVYLLWLDCKDEPELWVYDSNGEARYRDLASYLQGYLTDDLSAFDRSWRAQSNDLPYRWPTDAVQSQPTADS